MTNTTQGLPGLQLVDTKGNVVGVWYAFFLNVYNRLGGATGSISIQLDTITSTLGSLLYRATAGWAGLDPGTSGQVLKMGSEFPAWGTVDGSSFSNQGPNSFLAGPSTGSPARPAFRPIVTADLNDTAGEYPGTPTNDTAAAGNIGEYISSQVGSGSAVSLSTGTSADITSIILTPGDWDVWGNLTTAPAGTTTQSDIKGWINTVSATDPTPPNQGCYAEIQTSIAAGLSQTLSTGMMRVSVPTGGPQTVYLSTTVAFATSTLSAYGFLGARRRR